MDTGFTANQLYSACRLELTHHFADGSHCTDFEGTGFLVQFPEGDGRLGLVTNKHLANAEFYNSVENRGSILSSVKVQWWQTKDMLVEHVITDPEPMYHEDPLIDVAVIPIYAKPEMPITISATHYGDLIEFMTQQSDDPQLRFKYALSWEHLQRCEELWPQVQAGEFVILPGYPVWYDHLQTRPIMRSGLIASDPQTEYRFSDKEKTKDDSSHQIVFDAFSTSGNSGGPVYVAQRGMAPLTLNFPATNFSSSAQGKLSFDNYRQSFLIGINASHYNDSGIPRRNEHAGLSRMHKLSVLMDVLRKNKGSYDREAHRIEIAWPEEHVNKRQLKSRIANKSRDETIRRMRTEGKTLAAIAAEVGCSPSTVARVLNRKSTNR